MLKSWRKIEIKDLQVPVISNTTAKPMKQEQVKELLEKQVKSPVRFYESIEQLKQMGIEQMIEIGPGKVLTGFLKKIRQNHCCFESGRCSNTF